MKLIFNIIRNLQSILQWIFFEWRKFGIKKNDIVVDFGSGGRPLMRANILVDKFLMGITEGSTEFIDSGAFVIQCDLSKLPFKNKSIDFAYSSHTIEHLDNLEEFIKEMQRIAKRGYITCPSALREQIMAVKMHLWFIEKRNDQLLFTRKEKPYPRYIDSFFEKLLDSPKNYIWQNFEKHFKKEFSINYTWQGKINHQINNNNSIKKWKKEYETKISYRKNISFLLREKILIFSAKMIRFLFSEHFKIENILCCPHCRGDINILNDKFLACTKCSKRFVHKNKRIFYFLDTDISTNH